jgi:tetratricopeptide (TPR) repeat protein
MAVHRLLLARRALPRSEIAAVSGVEPHWQPLLESCIGYGDSEIRVSEVIRQVLLDALEASPTTSGGASALENAHSSLADYHESLDGASSLDGLERTQAINWMEKVHHLALGGSACAERWDRQQLAGREQLWERARHLSRNLHQFAVAARLYQSCLDAFGDDPYSQHYLAYNLERSGGSISAVRSGYAYAAAAEPENPWWQQRWIRFLITHGTLAEAHTAWQQALRAIDPDGSRLRRSPWLALNLHCWVARRWLALGRLEEARVVLSEVPAQWLQEAPLQELLELLAVQEQELALGESVYPESTPLSARWKEPQNLRPMRAGKPLVWWAPGRVLEALPGSVTVALAPTSEEAQQLTFEASRWQEMADEPAEDAQGFFEIGRYEGGEYVVRPMPDAVRKTSLDFEEAELRARVGR